MTSSFPAHDSDTAAPFLIDFVRGLEADGARVSVVTPDRGGEYVAWSGAAVTRFPWAGRDRAVVSLRLASPSGVYQTASLLRQGRRALRRVLLEERPDACLALWAVPAGYLAWRVCPPLGIPYSVWALGSDIHTWARRPLVGSLVAKILRDASHRYADGLGLADDVRRLSGLDCEFLPSSRRLPIPEGRTRARRQETFQFLFIGRLEAVKGPDVLVEAMSLLSQNGVAAGLSMIGSGSLSERLRQMVADHGLSHTVTMVPGGRPAAELAEAIAAADCLVIPSRQESIPVVFSEALQVGTPLLVTDVGDMGRLVREHGLAAPVASGDPHAMAAAMEAFVAERSARRKDFERARPGLLALFDPESSVRRFLGTVSSLTPVGA